MYLKVGVVCDLSSRDRILDHQPHLDHKSVRTDFANARLAVNEVGHASGWKDLTSIAHAKLDLLVESKNPGGENQSRQSMIVYGSTEMDRVVAEQMSGFGVHHEMYEFSICCGLGEAQTVLLTYRGPLLALCRKILRSNCVRNATRRDLRFGALLFLNTPFSSGL